MNVRQVLVFRRDLKHVRRGKMLSQSAHAAMMFLREQLISPEKKDDASIFVGDRLQSVVLLSAEEQEWFNGNFAKISLVVDGENELEALYVKVKEMGLTAHKVIDAGLTEFNGVPTLTCIAIGPHEKDKLDPVTGALELF